jgi:[FeFe] hydrogenase (group B1/B3)
MIENITRGLYTDVVDIRRKVFVETARLVIDNDYKNHDLIKIEFAKIPYKIISKNDPTYRCCVYRERAIVAERVRIALGLTLWKGEISGPVYEGIEKVLNSKKIKTEEIVNVIPEACEKCRIKEYKVTDNCRKCLAHPCSVVCPVNAVYFNDRFSVIDRDICIRCGRCEIACPYNAIVHFDRPCAAACGVDAIESDETNRAVINQKKCVKCGMCIVACPFGAIADKSEFVQLMIAIKENKSIYGIIAPSFIGQFGPKITPEQIIAGIKEIGFKDVIEVAYGADVATIKEGKEWYEKVVKNGEKFLGTSCCPAWVDMAKKLFPEISGNISDSFTPMVATAKLIKEKKPDSLVVFIGPCTAKKSESTRKEVKNFVDYVITFEELAAILVAKDIELSEIESDFIIKDASSSGRNYPISGGVAEAINDYIIHNYKDTAVKIDKRDSILECRKMLKEVIENKNDANLLEGMSCPGGCVGGAGIISPIKRTTREIKLFSEKSEYKSAIENPRLAK